MKNKCMRVQLVLYRMGRRAGGIAFLPSDAGAHRVNIFAWVEGDTVLVECKYPDGREVYEGVIRVLDSAGKELLNGKTNTKGEFSFKVPKQDDLTIVLEAGMGHRADWPLSKQDLAPDVFSGCSQASPTVDAAGIRSLRRLDERSSTIPVAW